MKAFKTIAAAIGVLWVIAETSVAHAAQVSIAVAANFTETAKEISAVFEARSGHKVQLSFGSSGQFYAQITQGAPFEVFLSADQERPRKLADDGLAVAGSRYTYAVGRLVLCSKDAGLAIGADTLRKSAFAKLAFSNPAAAPYGAAALETMKSLGLYEALAPKLVQGENIAQTYQFVETGNAELGFVALSQLAGKTGGARWLVPQELYAPIRQDAVLLKNGAESPVARDFLAFLKGLEARAIIEKFGYAAGDAN